MAAASSGSSSGNTKNKGAAGLVETGTTTTTTARRKIPAKYFYREFRGHRVDHLERLLPHLRASSDALIWTAGDSSLDNKYWFNETVPAVPGAYESVLQPPRSKPDVTYWLNHLLHDAAFNYTNNTNNTNSTGSTGQGPDPPTQTQRPRWSAINAAVEASTLNARTFVLRSQDIFLRDNIQADDVLIVSIGGNDIALAPSPCTIVSMLGLMLCMPAICIEKGCICGTVPIDDCCCGCGPSFCSCACACPPCLGYFRHLFGTRIEAYIRALTAKTKPSKILVCMIYYPDEKISANWAERALRALGYNRDPAKLQTLIRKVFQDVLSTIRIPGSQVIPVPLFHVLNGKNTEDYVARVEPSPSGGRKMAEFLLSFVENGSGSGGSSSNLPHGHGTAPSSSLIRGRD